MKTLGKILRAIRTAFIAVLVVLILIPGLLILFIPCKVFQGISRIIISIFRRDLDERLTQTDAIFAFETCHVRPKSTILTVLICDGPLSLEELQSNFTSRVLNYEDDQGQIPFARFKQYWVQFMGYFYWKKDKQFEIENHVRIYDYSSPDCSIPPVCSEEDLKRVAGYLLTEPFHKNQSPWEVLVIENYKFEQDENTKLGTVLALRIHHALADGYSIKGLLSRWFDDTTSSQLVFPKMSSFVQGLRGIETLLMWPWNVASLLVSYKSDPSAWNPVGAKMTRKYNVFMSRPISVDTFKTIAKAYGVTYNAVCYSTAAGAIVRMMKAAGHEVPDELTCIFPLPLPNHPGGLSNHAGQWFFNFYPHEMNSSQRLRYISRAAKPARDFQTITLAASWSLTLQAHLPIPLQKAIMPPLNVPFAVSNMPLAAKKIPISVHTNAVDAFVISGTVQNSSRAVSVMISWGGTQRTSLILDRAIQFKCPVESLDFDRFIQEEIADLLMMSQEEAV